MAPSSTDCRTEEGVTVGLIDSVIFIARVLSPRLKAREQDDESVNGPTPIQHALLDLEADEDVRYLFGHLGAIRKRWHREHRAPTAEEMMRDFLADPEVPEEAKNIGTQLINKWAGLDPQT